MYRRIIVLLVFIVMIMYLSIDISSEPLAQKEKILVEVKGEVEEEKMIEMDLGSSFSDLLEDIELSDKADLSSFSLNMTLYDKQIIFIPQIKETALISINSASLDDLCQLPGVGETIAKRIIAYRENIGCFHSLEDLKNVKGIGEIKFAKIKEFISL